MTNPRDAQTAPELDDKPDTIWVRVTDKSIMTRKPSDADEFDVEYRRADTPARAGMGEMIEKAFIAGADWQSGDIPLSMDEAIADLQQAEAQGADDHSLLAAVLRSRGKSNTLHDIMRAAKSCAHPVWGEPPGGTRTCGKCGLTTHPDDLAVECFAVDCFAVAMIAKLAKKRADGRGGWSGDACTADSLSKMLREHVEKGDPLDVGIFAMMLHQRGERIAPDAAQFLSTEDGEFNGNVTDEPAAQVTVADTIAALKAMPTRTEALGGQDFKYIQLGEALDTLRALARRRQMKALIVGGPNRGQVVDMSNVVHTDSRYFGCKFGDKEFHFIVGADVPNPHEYVMRELCRAYEYLMKGETHRQHIKKNGKL